MSNDGFDDPPTQVQTEPHSAKQDLGNVDDALAAGTPAAKFDHVGAVVKGVIVSAEMAQQRDFMTGKPKFWEDGNPCTQILIVLATDERNAEIEDDTGNRMLYVKKPGGMLKAIATALGKVKLSQAIGGTLAVKYTGDGTPPSKGMSPPKLYAARFTPASGAAPQQQTSQPANGKPTAADPRASAWQEFNAKVKNLTGDALKMAWKETVEGYSAKPVATLGPADWNLVANKIAECGRYVKEMAPYAGEPPTDVPAIDDIPF